jgi:hypothetical protein
VIGFGVHAGLVATPWLIRLLITTAMILVVYAALLLALGLDPTDRALLQKMIRKLGL